MGRFDFEYPRPETQAPDLSFEDTSLAKALGETVVWFEELDEQLCTSISFLLHSGDDVGRIVTAELSFRAKVDLFSSLFRGLRPGSDNLSAVRDFCAACAQIEAKRNQVMHSKWRHQMDGSGVTRLKYTARAKHGLRKQEELLALNQVEAIWVHCGYLAHSLDELMFWEFGKEYGEP